MHRVTEAVSSRTAWLVGVLAVGFLVFICLAIIESGRISHGRSLKGADLEAIVGGHFPNNGGMNCGKNIASGHGHPGWSCPTAGVGDLPCAAWCNRCADGNAGPLACGGLQGQDYCWTCKNGGTEQNPITHLWVCTQVTPPVPTTCIELGDLPMASRCGNWEHPNTCTWDPITLICVCTAQVPPANRGTCWRKDCKNL